MANTTCRIKIVRGDIHFEAEGDKKFVLDMLSRFDKPPAPPSGTPPSESRPRKAEKGKTHPAAPAHLGKETSPGEFIRQFRFKKHTDFVLAFGYYLEKHSGLTEFAPADINNCYYEAKMESSNTSQMIIQNIKRVYMMEAKGAAKGKKGARRYTLTRSGEEYIQKALTAGTDA